ncbi:MAG: riboflavin synthase [Candidatus Sumerlaeaceae bacterium]|nr:riboflavin synthase [Candidatus Sumerlaeaceae bacterium]
MFTGIIEEVGQITALRPRQEAVELQVQCRDTIRGAIPGDSIAVDGICLTVVHHQADWFTTMASAETLRRTNLVYKKPGEKVNLERPLTLDKKLGGHLVQGHVDGVGRIAAIKPEGDCQMWYFEISPELSRLLVCKGSVAVDGISLTVVDVEPERFSVAIIPKTLAATTFQFRKPGDAVNIETDIIGKYVYRYMHPEEQMKPVDKPGITLEILEKMPRA